MRVVRLGVVPPCGTTDTGVHRAFGLGYRLIPLSNRLPKSELPDTELCTRVDCIELWGIAIKIDIE